MPVSASYHPTEPAMLKLLGSFSRWRREDDAYHDNRHGMTRTRFLEDHQLDPEVPVAIPAGIEFLNSLPKVDVSEIPDEDKSCFVCRETYHSLADHKLDERLEVAVRLSCCRHTIGNDCLFQWLNPLSTTNNITCPFCRTECFPKPAPIDTVEGLQSRIDVLDWAAQLTTAKPPPHVRKLTWEHKTSMVKFWIQEAYTEVEQSGREINLHADWEEAQWKYLMNFSLVNGLGSEVQLSEALLRVGMGEIREVLGGGELVDEGGREGGEDVRVVVEEDDDYSVVWRWG